MGKIDESNNETKQISVVLGLEMRHWNNGLYFKAWLHRKC